MKKIFGLKARRVVLARWGRDESGAYAVEFALILPFFLPLLLVIIELGLMFLASHMLELGASKASRLIRVGSSPNAADFRAAICQNTSVLISCDKMVIDVRSYNNFSAFNGSDPELKTDKDGNIVTTYDLGDREEIQLVRVFYQYPTVIGYLIPSNFTTADGRLLGASFVFRNEPW